jgi:hypothetical protein
MEPFNQIDGRTVVYDNLAGYNRNLTDAQQSRQQPIADPVGI